MAASIEDPIPEVDELLRVLVRLINSASGLEVGLTLAVKGLLISGTAISWRDYYKGTAGYIRDATRGSESEGVADSIASIFDALVEGQEKLEAEDPTAKDAPPNFIHLKQARVFTGADPIPREQGMWWRGRLSEVDGFTVGNVNV